MRTIYYILDILFSSLHIGAFQLAITSSITLILVIPTALRLDYLYNNCDVTFLTIFILPTLSTFPVGGNRSARRKPTTFGRTLADLFTSMTHILLKLFMDSFNLPYFVHFVVQNKVAGILPFCCYPFFQIKASAERKH